jgi:hypothetical protein
VQRLTIQAASPLSAQGLYSAVSEFNPDFTPDDEATCFVSVDLGSDRHVAFVLDSLHRFVDSRAAGVAVNTVVVQLDGRRYRMNGTRASAASV